LFKKFDHEGGTHSPLIVSWPEKIHGKRAGSVEPHLSHSIDLMPTLLEAAGVGLPEQKPLNFEGTSFFVGLASGFSVNGPANRTLFWDHANGKAVRNGDWKLVAERKGSWELYNLTDDGTELNDLAEKMPERVAQMEEKFSAWKKRTSLSSHR